MAGRAALRDGADNGAGLLLIESSLDIDIGCEIVELRVCMFSSAGESGWLSARCTDGSHFECMTVDVVDVAGLGGLCD